MHGIEDACTQPTGGAVDQQPDRTVLFEQGDDAALGGFAFGEGEGGQARVKLRGVAVKQGARAV